MNIIFGSLSPHLFESFEFTHQSRSLLRSFFMNPNYLKNLSLNRTNFFLNHHLVILITSQHFSDARHYLLA